MSSKGSKQRRHTRTRNGKTFSAGKAANTYIKAGKELNKRREEYFSTIDKAILGRASEFEVKKAIDKVRGAKKEFKKASKRYQGVLPTQGNSMFNKAVLFTAVINQVMTTNVKTHKRKRKNGASVVRQHTRKTVGELRGAKEFSPERREKMSEKGFALPDGSYPIKSKRDLANAISAIGRAKNPEIVRKWIKKRANEMGITHLIPENW